MNEKRQSYISYTVNGPFIGKVSDWERIKLDSREILLYNNFSKVVLEKLSKNCKSHAISVQSQDEKTSNKQNRLREGWRLHQRRWYKR